MYTLQLILIEFLLPPIGPFLALLLALTVVKRRPAVAWTLAVLAICGQFAAAMPGMFLEAAAPVSPYRANVVPPYPAADAIVVLGGGRVLNAVEYGGDTADTSTLERVRFAAKLHRETGLPILVSGGKPGNEGELSEAAIMQSILTKEFSVPVRWVEDRSQDTQGNATLSAPLLQGDGIGRILLVTHGNHMDRASEAFRLEGLDVVPMPTRLVPFRPSADRLWRPSLYGFQVTRAPLLGWLASMKQRLTHGVARINRAGSSKDVEVNE